MRIIFEVSLRANGFEPQTERNNMRLKSIVSQYRTCQYGESSVHMGNPVEDGQNPAIIKFVNLILYQWHPIECIAP